MSTRSGKRIHNPSFEDIIQAEAELVVRSERKTRSKRVVENGDGQEVVLKSKKRQNYVSYPVNDDAVTGTNAVEVETLSKPARVLRRNTLREQNAAAEEAEPTTIVKKQARQKRRTKNVSETATEEIGTLEAPHETIEVVTITNGKPKSKKNKKKSTKVTEVVVIVKENSAKGNKKKKNKRKKNSQSNSLLQVEGNNGMNNHNDSNMSIDSFHSAAGSPVQVNGGSTSPEDVESGTHLIHDSTYQGKNKRKSSLKNKSNDLNSSKKIAMDVDIVLNTTFDKDSSVTSDKENSPRKSSQAKNTTFDKEKSQDNIEKLNITFDKVSNGKSNKNKLKSHLIDSTIENTVSPSPKTSSDLAIKKKSNGILNTTFEKDEILNESDSKKQRKSNIKVQINGLLSTNTLQQQFSNIIDRNNKSMSPRKSLRISENAALNGTFEISPKSDQIKEKSFNTTFDKESKLDTTLDKENKLDSTFDRIDSQKPSSEKSSLISSDATASSINVTLDKSDEISRISITDDDSRTENILNTTPLLVESSMEESKILESSLKENKTPELPPATTPLKREGTFTKEETEVAMSPKQTPNKRQTLPAAGCTPYHSNNKGSKKKSVLNLTHSIEKPGRRSSLAEVLPRATRVMFCSPVNNPVAVMQQKSKVIKSNLKGSNKSFVYEDSEPSPARPGRKRSLSHAPAPAAAKRSRLASTPTLRARSASAAGSLALNPAAKLSPPASPAPPPPRSDAKPTKLPNFAALHARRFERMESLEEGQQRRARRALLLLRPAGGLDVLARGSPRGTPVKPATPAKPPAKLPTLDTLQRGYTRFGFKMDCPVNPFSVPRKPLDKPKEIKPKAVEKKAQPSLAGATSLRRAAAKQVIMKEKSFLGKRDEDRKECRTIIKGVRTNRRFELQMKSRNING